MCEGLCVCVVKKQKGFSHKLHQILNNNVATSILKALLLLVFCTPNYTQLVASRDPVYTTTNLYTS